MVPKNTIKSYITEYQEFASNISVIEREFDLEEEGNYVFTGCRRSGKTYALFQIIQNRLAKGASIEEMLYINFEDERLLELKTEDLNGILEAYQELFPYKPILFFDEIQNIDGWEKFARRLADTKYQIYITGSNANMLSRDISTTLGGRFFVKEVFPLNFEEYLQFQGISFSEIDFFSPKAIEIKRAFNQYFINGGFPESTRFKNSREYVSNIYKKVLYGDIVARHNIRNDYALELLIKKLAESIGDESSNQRISNLLKASGAKLAVNTLVDYTQYCNDAYLIFKVNNYLSKFAERESRKKYYFIDNGILNLFLSKGKAQLFENFVFSHLLKTQKEDFFYLRDGQEVDFYLESKKTLIQASYTLAHPETRKRELKSISKMRQMVAVEKAIIITYEEEESLEFEGMPIEVLPAWKWALQ